MINNCLRKYNEEYIRYIIDEIENNVPSSSCYSDYGWDYDDLEEVIEKGLNINISLPSYNEWIKQYNRSRNLNEILKK